MSGLKERTAAVILAGGKAQRMGGGDKGARLLDGRPLLDHVAERIAPQVGAIAISANGDPQRFARWARPVIADQDGEGPTAGIRAAMRWAALMKADAVLTVPNDTPFLPPDLVARLAAARTAARAEVSLAASAGRVHWVIGLWPAALAAPAPAGDASVEAFVRGYRFTTQEFATGAVDPFMNLNRPEDLAAAERLLGR